jgi:formate-dependent nitrite reductase membrane component NrfD
MTMVLTWKWELVIYLWAAGIAGGAYFSAFLINTITRGKYPQLPKIAAFVGVPLVLVGSLLLVVDLGEQLRAWHLFTRFRPGSPMSMGSWILLLYALLGLAMIALWWATSFEPGEVRLTVISGLASVIRPAAAAVRVLVWIELALAVLLVAYTGVLLSATNQPLWGGVLLLPALFVASAVSTGMALLVLILRTGLGSLIDILFGGKGESLPSETLHTVGISSLILGLVELAVLIGYLLWLAFFSTAAGAAAVAVLLTGSMSTVFWGGVVLVGLLIPLILEFASLKGKEAVVGSMLASASLALVGGLFLRAAVLLGGQMT